MLTKDLIKKVRKIEITTNRAVNDHLAGRYHSVFRGRGMEFDEDRPYSAGDEVRAIDWNVSARTGQLYVKRFVEERQLTAMLLVDASASTDFATRGHQFKSELCAEISALIAFSAIKNNDRVGLIVFTDHVEQYIPPKRGRKHVLRVISELLSGQQRAGRGTDVAGALEYLSRVQRRATVAFLLSDFLAADGDRALRIAARRHDLVPVIIDDPFERELPNVGLILVQDAETGRTIFFDTADSACRRDYARRLAARREHRDLLLARLGVEAIRISTAEDYLRPLLSYFQRRAHRLAR